MKYLLLIVILLTSIGSQAQEPIEIEFENGEKSKVTSGYQTPEKNNLGLVYGFIQHMGMMNKPHTFWIGIEFAVLPNLSYTASDSFGSIPYEAITENGYVSLQFGLSFGGKTYTKEQ